MPPTFPRLRTLLGCALALLGGCTSARGPWPTTESFTLIAHRGASWDAPEHTFAAWDLALAQGVEWIEQDVTLTGDAVLVVFHDDTLGRTARGPAASCAGRVADHTLAALAACDVGRWFNEAHPERARADFVEERIQTLDAVLTRYRTKARFYIETKRPEEQPGMEEALLRVLRTHRLAGKGAESGRVIVQSFSEAGLDKLRGLDSALILVRLLEDPIPRDSLDATMQRIARTAQGIGPSRRIVTPGLIEAAHRAGLFVHVYTVNEQAVLAWMRANGADGVFTDRPGLLRGLPAP